MTTNPKQIERIRRYRSRATAQGYRVAQVKVHVDDLTTVLEFARKLREARAEKELLG